MILLPDWTSIPWADYGIAGAVILSFIVRDWAQRKDIMGMSSIIQKMAEEHAERMERLTDSCLQSITENTKVTMALNEYLRKNGHQPEKDSK